MSRKVLITIWENNVAPRFDLAGEVLIASLGEDGSLDNTKAFVLAHPSTDELCTLILAEQIDTVICDGIEQEVLDYLTWKKIRVIDSVMGPWERVLDRFGSDKLEPGSILFDRPER